MRIGADQRLAQAFSRLTALHEDPSAAPAVSRILKSKELELLRSALEHIPHAYILQPDFVAVFHNRDPVVASKFNQTAVLPGVCRPVPTTNLRAARAAIHGGASVHLCCADLLSPHFADLAELAERELGTVRIDLVLGPSSTGPERRRVAAPHHETSAYVLCLTGTAAVSTRKTGDDPSRNIERVSAGDAFHTPSASELSFEVTSEERLCLALIIPTPVPDCAFHHIAGGTGDRIPPLQPFGRASEDDLAMVLKQETPRPFRTPESLSPARFASRYVRTATPMQVTPASSRSVLQLLVPGGSITIPSYMSGPAERIATLAPGDLVPVATEESSLSAKETSALCSILALLGAVHPE